MEASPRKMELGKYLAKLRKENVREINKHLRR